MHRARTSIKFAAPILAAFPALFNQKNPVNDSENNVKREIQLKPQPDVVSPLKSTTTTNNKQLIEENEIYKKSSKCYRPNIDALLSSPELPVTKWDNNWDFRDPVTMAKDNPKYLYASEEDRKKMIADLTPKATRNIFLIRHGQYVLDAEREEKKLTPLGREQAVLLGKRFTGAKQNFKLDDCIFSTMVRARETGQIMQSEMPHFQRECRLDPMLEEGPPYPPDPRHSSWTPKKKAFHEHGPRIEAAFRKYFHRASTKQTENNFEIIVCHANVIRYFVCRALQFPPEGWLRISLAHTSITWIQIYPNGRVCIKAMGDFGHLPPEKISFE